MGKKKEVKELTKQIVASFELLMDLDPEAALDAMNAAHDRVGGDPRMAPVIIKRVMEEADKQVQEVRQMMNDAGVMVFEMTAEEAAKFIEENAISAEKMQSVVDADIEALPLRENKEN